MSKASCPNAAFASPVVLLDRALNPNAEFCVPDMVRLPAFSPRKVFAVPKLCRNSWLSFKMLPAVGVELDNCILPPARSSLAVGTVVPMPMLPELALTMSLPKIVQSSSGVPGRP